MKKNLLVLFVFFILSCSSDENKIQEEGSLRETDLFVSSDMAKSVALSFLENAQKEYKQNQSADFVPVSGFEDHEIDQVIVVRDEKNVVILYVVTFLPKGYIVVSATKKEMPVLGYAIDVNFDVDNLPIGLADWFINRIEKIQFLNYSEGMEIPSNVREEWDRNIPIEEEENPPYSAEPLYNEVSPLLQTLWGQGRGYNNYTPELNCDGQLKRAPTGCVATAVAQVIRYHEFPHFYHWQIMPNMMFNYTDQGANEVSKLMSDIGIYVGMDYDCNESGAQTSKVVDVLVNKFSYATSVSFIDYNSDILALELTNNRPVILSGKHSKRKTGSWIFEKTTYGEGHAWVCDGFRETIYRTVHDAGTRYERVTSTPGGKFFHMNWGWNGIGNETDSNNKGWFRYDDFEIKGVSGNDGENLNFQYKKKMIIGIKP